MKREFKGRRVLVTGAAGFIGSALVHRLHTLDAKVRAFVRYTSRGDIGLLNFLPQNVQAAIDFVYGDLRDHAAVEKAAQGAEVIFHLGALISIPYSYIHPVETVQSNVIGTLNVLEACRKSGSRLVHTSTSEVYGTAQTVPINESHPLQGQSPYSASKIGADKLVESYTRAFDLRAVTIRPFNTYGPGQSARAVIPTIISQALVQDEIHLGNLAAKRDFTYIGDTVEGFIKAAQADQVIGETINLGYGEDISIGELAEMISDLLGKDIRIVVDEKRLRPEKSEVMRLVSDNTKAWELLRWEPKIGIREGLKQTIGWVREHLDWYRVGKYEK